MTGPRDARHDFSFSGLKTAVARRIEAAERAGDTLDVADVAASFQEAVADVLTVRAVRAGTDLGDATPRIGGGVAANARLRELATERGADDGITLRVPRPRLCTDNGAMVVGVASALLAAGAPPSALSVAADPGLPVETTQVR